MLSVPKVLKRRNIPSIKNASPMRLTTKALRAAFELAKSVYQKPISRNDATPTPSQPMNSTGKLSPNTRISIIPTKKFKYAKNLEKPLSPCM